MEVATKLVSSPSYHSRTHLKQFPHPHSHSVLKRYEHSTHTPTSMLTVSLPQHFPTSVLIQEQRYDNKPVLQIMEERTSQVTLDRRVETDPSKNEENDTLDGDLYLKEFQRHFLRLPGLRSGSLHVGEELSLSLAMQSVFAEKEKLMDAEINNVVALAKKALSASREAAILTNDCKKCVTNLDESFAQRSGSLHVGEELSLSLAMQSVFAEKEKLMDAEINNVVALAKKALSASREAAILTNDCKKCVTNLDESFAQRSGSLHVGEELSLSLAMQSVFAEKEKLMDAEINNVVALAKKALSASREAAILTNDCKKCVTNLDESFAQSSGSICYSERPVKTVKTVRSTRLLERQSKKRKIPNSVIITTEINMSKTVGAKRTPNKNFHSNDILCHFVAPETTQLLTAKEESKLIVQLKDLRCLEKIKSRLQVEFGREPTMVEWAEAVGLTCNALQSRINCGKRSGEKLVYANIRMVAHMAKHYQNNGLSLPDLVQEGSVGLLKGVVKYNPQSGCRFSTYAYWWIKQSIKIAIHQKSRTVRLPVSVYTLMYKVTEAKRIYAQEGNLEPTIEQIAMHAGVSVEKLQRFQVAVRNPISMQQCVWNDQDTTFQEITPDPVVESPKRYVEKKYMRNHVRNLLNFLPPMERKVITLRYGIGRGYSETLAGIGAMVGISDERIRRFEMQGLNKLKQLMSSQGLDAYADLLF